MNNELTELIQQLEEYASGGVSGLYPFEESVKALLDYINQLESTLNEVIDWKDKNGNRYIYQDSLGEDWYFYDLDVFDELGEILNKVGGSNE